MAGKQTKRTIRFMAPIEDVSAKFARVKDTCSLTRITGKSYNKWFGAGVRTYGTAIEGPKSKQYFIYRKFPRTSAPDAAEQGRRETFAFSMKWGATTMQDLSLYTRITAEWKAGTERVGISAVGYTMAGWVKAVRYAQKKADPSITEQSPEYGQWPAA